MGDFLATIDAVDIIGFVLLALTATGLFVKLSGKLKVVKEAIDVLFVGVNAIMDGKLTVTEKTALKKEIEEFKASLKQ